MFNLLAILISSSIIFFRNIDKFPLRNWDEAWYTEIIKNMASGTHSLLVPFWNGQYYFDKPPLYFWLSLPIVKFFGAGQWQVRLVSVIAAILALLFVYLTGKKLFNRRVGLIAFVVFVSLGQVVIRFAHGNLDALLIFLFLASFYFYLLSLQNRFPRPKGRGSLFLAQNSLHPWHKCQGFFARNKIFAPVCGIALGLGFLVKGWFVGLYPALIITLYSLFTQKKLPRNLVLIVIFTLISSSWYFILGTLRFGGPFFNWYLLNPAGGLLKSPLSSFSLTYFGDLIKDIGFWWIPIVVFALKFRKIAQTEEKILITFLASILLFIFPLNFLSEKLGWYNLPAYPLVALVIAFALEKLYRKSAKVTVLLILVILILQVFNVNRIENIYPDRSQVGASLGLLAQKLIPKEDTVVLDDHDFTAFLFYSNHGKVFVVDREGPKPGEWWILKYGQLPMFINDNPKTWIVTPNLENLPFEIKSEQVSGNLSGYSFIKLY